MEKKKQHTVPRCYLENFSDDQGYIWALSRTNEEDKIIKIKPKNILTENHFYTIKFGSSENVFFVEDTLANIEADFSEIFKNKIDKQTGLSLQERAKVAIFVAAMHLRTKTARESMRKGFIDLDKKLDKWRKLFENNPEARKFSSETVVHDSEDSFTQDEIKEAIKKLDDFHSLTMIENLPEIAQIIFDMHWGFIIPENESEEFITSDHPCVLLRPEAIKKHGPNAIGSLPGFLYKDVEITLPLSSKKALLAGWNIESRECYVPMPTKMIEQINQRTTLHFQEKVIASSNLKIEEVKQRLRNAKEKSMIKK